MEQPILTFKSLQSVLSAELNASRESGIHPGSKGDETELCWLKMLQKHLPYRYQADKASVIDNEGATSDQIDIVIYDRQYTPILYNHKEQRTIPAESIYAVFEVKQTIEGQVKYAGEKVASVRRLKRTTASIRHAGGEIKVSETKPPPTILGGILATSTWKSGFGKPFQTAIEALEPLERLDLGCAIDKGSFAIEYKDNIAGELEIEEKYSLAFFFFKLLEKLQKMGTVPAIDYQAYIKNLRSLDS
jgi:hypothetical protein